MIEEVHITKMKQDRQDGQDVGKTREFLSILSIPVFIRNPKSAFRNSYLPVRVSGIGVVSSIRNPKSAFRNSYLPV
jgi:hypothetical protein